ncbi:hypothetical protein HDU81_006970 [Chytriomyces hyalinus]|nr:hypothetical protein HDU81_006970 [Chytriomyces hyalinus]
MDTYDYHTLHTLSSLDSLTSYHTSLYDLHAVSAHPNIPFDMTLEQILLDGPMLLETEQHCDMEMFSNVPFEPAPPLQTTLDQYDYFAAAAHEPAHQQLYDLTHDQYQDQQHHDHYQQHHHHYEHHYEHHHAVFPEDQLMSPLFDAAAASPSSYDSSITPKLSHSPPPPSPPVFLPLSIVAPPDCKDPALLAAASPLHRDGKTENLTRCLIKTEAPGASPTLSPHSMCFESDALGFDPVAAARMKPRKQQQQQQHFPAPVPATITTTITRKRSTKKYARSKSTDTQHSSSSDNDTRLRRVGGTSKKRHTLAEDQADLLKACFEENRFLQPKQASKLAAMLGMSETQVKIWFQNRRAYGKRKGYRRKSRAGTSRGQHDEEEDDWE